MVSQGLHISKSSIWLGLRPLLNDIFQHATWTVGNGESIYFWTDRWLAMPIVDIWQIHVHLHKVLTMKVADFVIEGQWQIPDYFLRKDVSLVQQIYCITLPIDSVADTLNWNNSIDGNLTNKLAFDHLKGTFQRFPCCTAIWNKYTPFPDLLFFGDLLTISCPLMIICVKEGVALSLSVVSVTIKRNLLIIFSYLALLLLCCGIGLALVLVSRLISQAGWL